MWDLTNSNPTIAFEDYPHAAIAAALKEPQSYSYQPDAFGNNAARSAIGRRFGVDPTYVALTASTSEAYSVLFKLLCNPGDEVLTPTPSYPLLEHLAQLDAVALRSYSLAYDGAWHIDFDSLKFAINPRTRAIVIVNPNNPTGSYLKGAEYRRLTELAIAHSLPLISDEVFVDYSFGDESDQRVKTLIGTGDCLSFSLNGLSKSAGLPQLKLGWLVVNGPAAERRKACDRLELLLDTYLSVSLPIQLAAERLFTVGDGIQLQIRRRVETSLLLIDQLLKETPIHRLHSEGGWSAILRVPNMLTEEQWITRLLQEQDVIVQPGYFFDMPDYGAYLVVSLLTETNVLREGITRLRNFTQR